MNLKTAKMVCTLKCKTIYFIILMVSLYLYPVSGQTTQTITFNYTGAAQQFTVPACANNITVTIKGAQGGGGANGGMGATVSGVLSVTAGQILQVNVGGQGVCPNGGWNGGGNGWSTSSSGQMFSCGGGGSSDIRIPPYGLPDRVVVASGGGGQNGGSSMNIVSGGTGGCATGNAGQGSPFTVTGGNGGTQTSGGTGGPPWGGGGNSGVNGVLWQGGDGGNMVGIDAAGGGGGGGYYGGGGGGSDGCCIGANGGGAGGGGSSLVPVGMACAAGNNAGNGQVTIVYPICSCTVAASNSGNICVGQSFGLAATTVTNATSYAWTGPNGFSSNLQNAVLSNAGANASGTYTMLVTAPTGTCNAVTSLTVVSPGTITISQPDTICAYSNYTLTSSNNSTLTTSYQWSGPSFFNSNQQNPALTNVTSANTGVYSLTTTVSSGTLQCPTTATTSLYVIPIYTPNITTSQTICVGDNATFSVSASGANAYSWAGPNSYTANSQSISFNNAQANLSGTYTATAVFILGSKICLTTTNTALSVLPKITFTLPLVPFACIGDPLIINGPAGAQTYTWTSPTGQVISNQQNLNIPNVNFGMSGPYTLSVQPTGGCITSNTVNVTVLSPISFSYTPSNMQICKGDSVVVYAFCTGGSGVYNYQWTPTTGLYFPSGYVNIVKPTQTTYYTIIANDAACPSNTISSGFIVNVLPVPTPNFSYSKIEGCKPLCLGIKANPSPPSINTIWDFGYNLYANGDSVSYCFNNPGVYPVKVFLVDSNGCKSETTAPFSINVYPRPEPQFTWLPVTPTLLHDEVSFTASYQNGPITYWHWDFGDYLTASDTARTQNATYTYSYVSAYPVQLIATNIYGCTDTVTRIINVTEEFTMYIPNAFTPNGDGINDMFTVKGGGFVRDGFEMQIFDRWGELIFKSNDVDKGWDGTVKGVNAKNDVYVYKIRCFTVVQNIKKEFIGHVLLYR